MDAGLENVVAAETVLSDVDGANGRLVIRGHAVEQLSATASFEEAIHLLWDGFFADLPTPEVLARKLGKARVAAFAQRGPATPALSPIEAVRAGLARLKDGDGFDEALMLVAASAVETAAAVRLRAGLAPIAPDASLSHAADFLRMLRGVAASDAEARALDCYLVTVCDHGLNASTFAARVVASTQAGLVSAGIAGVSALKGPLHGGAPAPALDMIDAIGEPANAEAWIDDALKRGERLMGFGHRIYRVRDPRADALKAAIKKLPTSLGRLELGEAIERAALETLAKRYPNRRLDTNVEFYTALLLDALAIPREAFTCIFACARMAGWIAHSREQLATKRLVRPASVYVGPPVHDVAA
jgi:citrate synthase